MALQAGIVGLPNVGKSTLFNALTAAGAASANYPFCTIEPNVGVVPVPDERLALINKYIPTEKILPAIVEIVDIAGLVKGASQGEGLGNQFLGHIRAVDAVLHVVRCFESSDIIHVENSVNPLRDIETIHTELILADLDSLDKRIRRFEKLARGNAEAALHLATALKARDWLNAGKLARSASWTEEERASVKDAQLITALPMLFVCNTDEEGVTQGNAHTRAVEALARESGCGHMVLCAQVEAEISEMPAEDRAAFLADLGLGEPGLHSLARETYRLLGLRTYFTAGPKEIRAWTIHSGDTAPKAAGVIHSDFERGFIRAEVYSPEDLARHGSEAALRSAGKLRVEGKEYVIQDGDIMHFRFNV